MSEKTTKKRVNKSEGELVAQMKEDKKKEIIKQRMGALEKLEYELGCVFVPMIQYTRTGSQTYIAPLDAPVEPKNDVASVEKKK